LYLLAHFRRPIVGSPLVTRSTCPGVLRLICFRIEYWTAQTIWGHFVPLGQMRRFLFAAVLDTRTGQCK
jgi:hypothetical protein